VQNVQSPPQSASTLQTADRALQVLQQFQHAGEALTVSEIAGRLSLHRSTASRLVSTLRARGFLERGPGEAVRLGPEAVRLGRLALAGRQLIAIAQPVMDRLAQQTGEAVTLAMPAGGQVLTVAESGSSYFVSSGHWVGVRTPAHCTADGKVLLAFGAIIGPNGVPSALTSRTITDPGVLETELAAVRSRGYAVARGELEDGLDGLAVPVSDGTSCAAALCISGPDYRMNRRSETSDARVCREAAVEIEQRLGAPSPSLTRQERGRP
jgi:DNA-binding IclR family transcriptional regulator